MNKDFYGVLKPASLSPQRAKVLAFLHAEVAAGRRFPSREQIRDHMGWKNESSVIDVLHTLAGRGDIKRKRSIGGWKFYLRKDNVPREK